MVFWGIVFAPLLPSPREVKEIEAIRTANAQLALSYSASSPKDSKNTFGTPGR